MDLHTSKNHQRDERNARRILILVPNRWRDLDGHALLGYHLRSCYGHNVELCDERVVRRRLLEYAPDAIVIDHLGIESRADLARLANRLGARVIVLPTAGFFHDREREARRAGKLFGVSHLVDRYLTWGESARNHLLEAKLLTEDQLYTVGCVRFDFYSQPYLSLIRPKEIVLQELGITRVQAPLVVWTTNTYFANLGNAEEIVRGQVINAKRPEEELRAEIADCVTQFKEHSTVVLTLARRHPDWNILIRIHPTEAREPYEALSKETPNIYLGTPVPIREVLYYCDVLLQRGCTTSTEAWMLGKPVLELAIGRYNIPMDEQYLSCNLVVSSTEEAESAIVMYLNGVPCTQGLRRARERFITETYYQIDGKASLRAAKLIDQCVSPPSYSDKDQTRTRIATKEAYSRWVQAEDRRFANRLKDALGADRDVSLRFWKMNWKKSHNSFGLMTADNTFTTEAVQELFEQYQIVSS